MFITELTSEQITYLENNLTELGFHRKYEYETIWFEKPCSEKIIHRIQDYNKPNTVYDIKYRYISVGKTSGGSYYISSAIPCSIHIFRTRHYNDYRDTREVIIAYGPSGTLEEAVEVFKTRYTEYFSN